MIGRAHVGVMVGGGGSNCGYAMLMFGEEFFCCGLSLKGFLVMRSFIVGLLGGGYGWLMGLGWDGVFRKGCLVFGFAGYPVDIDVHYYFGCEQECEL